MPNRHLAGIRAGALLLMLAATGCSQMTHSAVGTLLYTTPTDEAVLIENPITRGCHSLGPVGAKAVTNNTLNDIVLYEGADCRQPQGAETVYVATLFSDSIVPGYPAWRSFSFVGV
jgi:hypothetical protein